MFSKISYFNYRNLKNGAIELDSPRVQIFGKNGAGKSNFLSIVYFLCYGTSSVYGQKEENILKINEKESSVLGDFVYEDEIQNVKIKYSNKQKEIFLDDVKIKDRTKLFENKSCIYFSSFDSLIINSSMNITRKFFDQSITLSYDKYISYLRTYQKIIKNRNLSLKRGDIQTVNLFNQELVKTCILIKDIRDNFISKFNQQLVVFAKNFTKENLSVEYKPNIKEDSFDVILDIYNKNINMDLKYKMTTKGIHKDRYVFKQNGYEYFSQGQMKIFAIIIKLVLKDMLFSIANRQSILIFDDALSDLDSDKRENIQEYFKDTDSIFFSSMSGKLLKDFELINISDGVLEK